MNAFVSLPIILVAGFLIHQKYRKKKIIQLCLKKNEKLLPPLRSPDNIIIAFDLHGVLFRHDYKKMLSILWKSPDKWQLIKTMLNPRLWIHTLKLSRSCTVPEAFIMQLAKQHIIIKKLLPTIIHIMNAQKPHDQTVALLHNLKKQGYQLSIISNIGETIYRDLEQQFPRILQLFDNVIVTCAANGYISKPNPKMYFTYLASIDNTKKTLFIDDKIRNVHSALACGIATVYYESYEKALATLKKLILV